jgi:hypothetical protein
MNRVRGHPARMGTCRRPPHRDGFHVSVRKNVIARGGWQVSQSRFPDDIESLRSQLTASETWSIREMEALQSLVYPSSRADVSSFRTSSGEYQAMNREC